jgi:hypothetical protein
MERNGRFVSDQEAGSRKQRVIGSLSDMTRYSSPAGSARRTLHPFVLRGSTPGRPASANSGV